MKTLRSTLLFLLFSFPVFATSTQIKTFQLSGVGSGMSQTASGEFFWASDPAPNFSYNLTATNTTGSTSLFAGGYFSLHDGSTYLQGSLFQSSISSGVFYSSFTGDEIVRLGPNDWVYWAVTGTLQQTVNFSAPLGTGSINITGSTFEGRYPEVPEPGTWMMVGTGVLAMYRRLKPTRFSVRS